MKYQELVQYKERYGDCLVPSRGLKNLPPEESEKMAKLGKWVQGQRVLRKNLSPSVTHKRIELLDAIGFAWSANEHCYDGVRDAKFHAACAAKLFFSNCLTAKEAM